MSSDARARIERALTGGARDALASAVIHGLLRFPDQISRHAEALGRLARLDAKTTDAIESMFELAETLDSRGEEAISVAEGLPAPPERNRYAFLREGTDPGDACAELAEAVSLLVEKPALEAAMAAATARFDQDPEGSFAEQSRLRERLATLNERLKNFGRRKAAAAAEQEFEPASADEPVADMETD